MIENTDGTSTYNKVFHACFAFPHNYQKICIRVARFNKTLFFLLFAPPLYDAINNIETTSRDCDSLICNIVPRLLITGALISSRQCSHSTKGKY